MNEFSSLQYVRRKMHYYSFQNNSTMRSDDLETYSIRCLRKYLKESKKIKINVKKCLILRCC